MNTAKKASGVAIATAAAALFLSGMSGVAVAAEGAASANVHCYGVTSCKGTSACKTASNACKGQNSCKGQGFLSMSAEDCTKKGGKTSEG